MFNTRTKKRYLSLEIPAVRRLRPRIKTKRTNQFLDNPIEKDRNEEKHENGSFLI